MLLLQESVHIFQSTVGQEDNEEERRSNLHQEVKDSWTSLHTQNYRATPLA